MFRECEGFNSFVFVAEVFPAAKSKIEFEKRENKMIGKIKNSPFSKWLKGNVEADDPLRSMRGIVEDCLIEHGYVLFSYCFWRNDFYIFP